MNDEASGQKDRLGRVDNLDARRLAAPLGADLDDPEPTLNTLGKARWGRRRTGRPSRLQRALPSVFNDGEEASKSDPPIGRMRRP